MNVPLLKGLNLDKYWELIRLGFGEDCPFALCDSGGLPVWTSDGEIGTVISRLNDQGFEWATGEAGAFRQSLGDDRVLVYEPVTPRNDHVAWLAVLVKLGAAHLAELQLRGADSVLRSLGACIGDEYRLNYEVISLAGALSQRQDE
ncbi:MAG: hypothetical protein V3T14_12170, partial [Myxococcota bacterium]